ncbi:hypothetical protein ODJ79_10700 [Actinoplanes sp. KI2]|uniref:hypothetical protein n=1 Tax=Actinoplanes sp. KI2 TaxID=2983315 RepID=UPI0021D5D5BD|nr:hypothetical protein [Actinoplanes sp. KI2]MCU7724183.1 hypothetical protein [Actinoplanes sp. KI2]
MRDRLDEVLAVAAPLLAQVDAALADQGAPADHEVWRQLRRVRLLPGDAARAVASLRPAEFDEAAGLLRADARACAEVAQELPAPGQWDGEAAEAYVELRERVADRLSGDGESLDERLEASADLAEALIDWMVRSRAELALALAGMLASGDAVALTAADDPLAAAALAAQVLRTVAESYAEADDLLQGSAELAAAIAM